jgi:hypothetical protein
LGVSPPTQIARRWLLRWPRLFVRLFAPDDAELGRLGEELAARTLVRHGYRIEARGLRTRDGEADLVVRTRGTRAVVEVKTGRATASPRPRAAGAGMGLDLRWRPGLRCDDRRLARLRRVVRAVHADRIDLVEVFLVDPGRRFRVLHHEDLRHPLRGCRLEGEPEDLR